MMHQGCLSPQNQQMVLHVREMFFNADGWPVVSPERFAGTQSHLFTNADLLGEWEVIHLCEPLHERELETGQILWGEGELKEEEWNKSFHITLHSSGKRVNIRNWSFSTQNQTLNLPFVEEEVNGLSIFMGQDWENQTETILFTGLDRRRRSVWGKRIN